MVRKIRKSEKFIEPMDYVQEAYLVTVEQFNEKMSSSMEFLQIESTMREIRDKIMQNLFERSSQSTYIEIQQDLHEVEYLNKLFTVYQETIVTLVENYIIDLEIPNSEFMQSVLFELDVKTESLYHAYYKIEITSPLYGIEERYRNSEVVKNLEKLAAEIQTEFEKNLFQGPIDPLIIGTDC